MLKNSTKDIVQLTRSVALWYQSNLGSRRLPETDPSRYFRGFLQGDLTIDRMHKD